MNFWKKKYILFLYKTMIVLIAILFLKVFEMVVFQRIIHWFWDIPVNNKEEYIDIIVILMILSPFTYIVMKQKKHLQEAEEKYKVLAEDSLVGIYTYQDGNFTYVNNRFLEIIGYNKNEIIGMDFHDLIVKEDQPVLVHSLEKNINEKNKSAVLQIKGIKKDNSIIDLELYCTIAINRGRPMVLGSILEISERIRTVNSLKKLAYYDQLTGLPNRKTFEELVRISLTKNKGKNTNSAVMFLDLDGFKQLNDTYGHHAGDLLLKEIANRLTSCVRVEDTVSRFAGDEFVIFIKNINKDEVKNVVDRILENVNTPFTINQSNISVSASIGIAFYPEHGEENETLIRNADKAMYKAKIQEKNTYCIF